EGPIHHLQRQF
nr:immunoglobulin heavy chain junction region [Homo sapiens]